MKRKNKSPKRFSVYVFELPPEVAKDTTFKKKNPNYEDGQVCLYVGMTGRTPEERYEQHQSREGKAARPAKKYGVVALRRDLYEGLNPMTYDDALEMEEILAQRLRKKGFGVWK